jgi:hypothetical protein
MRERRDDRGAGTSAGRRSDLLERLRGDLLRLGVDDEVREELARRLEVVTRRLSPEAYDSALAGAVLAHGLHREGEDALRRSVRDLNEIQRLLGAFGDEMRKLEEALEILGTYLKRMRSRAARPATTSRLLH